MNVSHQNIDAQNAVITITIDKNDYQEKVDKQLKSYQKTASIPGFRKGMAPMGMIKKQYENALRLDEINKMLQQELFQYLEKEKFDYLGQPIPTEKETLDWESEAIDFQFRLGLVPSFEVNLNKVSVPYYVIEASDDDVTESIERMRTQQGEAKDSDVIEKTSFFTITIQEVNSADDQKISDQKATIMVSQLKDQKAFIGKKVGDAITIKAQDLFEDLHQLQHKFGLSHDDAHHFNAELSVTIDTIKTVEPVALDEKLFQAVFPTEEITTEADFRQKIKEELTAQYKKDTDMFFMNDTTDYLMEHTELNLPKEFLIDFFQNAGEKPMSKEESEAEYEKSEKGIKYQLIEGKIAKENEIKIGVEDIIAHAKASLRNQLAMYGYKDITEEELDKLASESMKDRNSIQRYNDEVLKDKMMTLFHEKVSKKEQKMDYTSFVKMVEEKNHQHS